LSRRTGAGVLSLNDRRLQTCARALLRGAGILPATVYFAAPRRAPFKLWAARYSAGATCLRRPSAVCAATVCPGELPPCDHELEVRTSDMSGQTYTAARVFRID